MMTHSELIDWFHDRDIVPSSGKTICHSDYVSLMFDAAAEGRAFRLFTQEVVVPTSPHHYTVNPESWDELFEAYLGFFSGYAGHKA